MSNIQVPSVGTRWSVLQRLNACCMPHLFEIGLFRMVTSCSNFISIQFAHACVLPLSVCIAVEYGSNHASDMSSNVSAQPMICQHRDLQGTSF